MDIDKPFYKKCRRDTWRLLKRLPEPDAQDVLQEALCRLMRLERKLLIQDPAAYLYAITAHVAMEFRRKKRREERHLLFDSETAERVAKDNPGAASPPLEDAVDTTQYVQGLLSHLPPTHRAVVVLTQCFGFTREEAARKLSLSPHTVKTYTYQGIRWIRQLVLGRDDSHSENAEDRREEPDCE